MKSYTRRGLIFKKQYNDGVIRFIRVVVLKDDVPNVSTEYASRGYELVL